MGLLKKMMLLVGGVALFSAMLFGLVFMKSNNSILGEVKEHIGEIINVTIADMSDSNEYRQKLLDLKKEGLEKEVQTIHSQMIYFHSEFVRGKITEAEAKAQVRMLVKNTHYGKDNKDYLWINDMSEPFAIMIMHPTVPELDGKPLDATKFNCALGKKENLFNAFVQVCKKDGEGFVDYSWPKPTKDGLSKEQPKLSFVKSFEPWGWIIGTGIYIDDIDADVAVYKEKQKVMTDKLLSQMTEKAQGALEELKKEIGKAMFIGGGITVIIFFVSLMISYLSVKKWVINPLHKISTSMTEGADQVTIAADEIAASSQTLAEGASQQAAAVEETSASLEEVGAMIKQGADNTGQADGLMKEANRVIQGADASMKKLIISMDEISAASTQTQKIVKTIDEIAFQTNLLALNAAVEAARAGEAGAGFAVVADEVRNLAMRAAEAAKNTSDLIEGTVQKVNAGSTLANETSESFQAVTESTTHVGGIIEEIAEASRQQAEAVGQITKAVHEIDSVTQSNAAAAEEAASASEELSAQAETMRSEVTNLLEMVDGGEQSQSIKTKKVQRK